MRYHEAEYGDLSFLPTSRGSIFIQEMALRGCLNHRASMAVAPGKEEGPAGLAAAFHTPTPSNRGGGGDGGSDGCDSGAPSYPGLLPRTPESLKLSQSPIPSATTLIHTLLHRGGFLGPEDILGLGVPAADLQWLVSFKFLAVLAFKDRNGCVKIPSKISPWQFIF